MRATIATVPFDLPTAWPTDPEAGQGRLDAARAHYHPNRDHFMLFNAAGDCLAYLSRDAVRTLFHDEATR